MLADIGYLKNLEPLVREHVSKKAGDELEKAITELERQRAALKGATVITNTASTEIRDRDAENERLRTALKPFAETARLYVPYSHSIMADKVVSVGFTLGQLRAAFSAYEEARK